MSDLSNHPWRGSARPGTAVSGTFGTSSARLEAWPRRRAAALVLLLCVGLCGIPAALQGQEPDGLSVAIALEGAFVKAIEAAEPSVVSIARDRVEGTTTQRNIDPAEDFRRLQLRKIDITHPDYIPNEFGAGVIVREDGLILTNYHVVRGGPIEGKNVPPEQILYVRLSDRRGFPAKIHAADPRSDLAVLKIDAANLKAFKLGNAAPVRKGQIVLALGNPYAIARDGAASATWGIVSNLSRKAAPEADRMEPLKTIHQLGTLLQIDTRLDLGTSGGALLNLRGELIGLTTSLSAVLGYEKSAGFAIPIDEAMLRVVETLIRGEEVEYGFLGIHPEDAQPHEQKLIAERFGQQGAARIMTVIHNSPAHQGGLLPHDIVLSINGKPILGEGDLMREVGLLRPTDLARMKVCRDLERTPQTLNLDVYVGKWPVIDDEGIVASKRRHEPWRGLVVDFVTGRKKYFIPGNTPHTIPNAVVVTEVEAGSPAEQSDLQAGDFILQAAGRVVRTPRDFYDVLRPQTGDVTLTLGNGKRVIVRPK